MPRPDGWTEDRRGAACCAPTESMGCNGRRPGETPGAFVGWGHRPTLTAMTELNSPTSIMDEKPLSPAARAGLVVNAAVTILLFYLTAILFMAGFTALALLLLLVTMAAARFGMASFVGRLLQRPVRLIWVLGGKLWVPAQKTHPNAPAREGAAEP